MTTGGTIAGFAFFFGGSIALACIFDWIIRRSPLREAEPSRLDALDAQTSFGFRRSACAVLRCDSGVDVWVHSGHDWWGFCLTHGLPHLRDEAAL